MFLFVLFFSFSNIFYSTDTNSVKYNKATLLYFNTKYVNSTKIFNDINFKDTLLQAKVYLQLGNIAYKEKKYMEAIDYYKNALRQNSKMLEAKQNLYLARIKFNKEKQKENLQTDEQKNKEQQEMANILANAKQLENQTIRKSKSNQNSNTYIKNW